jgi:hypothetical protein
MATKWPNDTTAAKNAFYGDFHGKAWSSINLVQIVPPFKMFYDKKPLKGITVHRKVADAMMAAFTEIWDACDHDQAKVDKTGASDYGGCFNIRSIAGSNNYSNHSWACAIDLAPSTNGFNMKGTLPSIVITAFKRQGALWGGDYKGRKDPMHFEFVSR